MMRLSISCSRDETPVDALEGIAVFVIRIRIDATYEIVLLICHNPRTCAMSIIPGFLGAEICRFHGTVTVVSAVCFRIAVVKAAPGVVMMSAYDPILAFCLVVHGRTMSIVPSQAHTGSNEYSINLVTHECSRCGICERNVVESSHCRTAEPSARCLIQVISIAGLIVKYGNPAVCILAELILRCGIRISSRVACTCFDDLNIDGFAVGLPHDLI